MKKLILLLVTILAVSCTKKENSLLIGHWDFVSYMSSSLPSINVSGSWTFHEDGTMEQEFLNVFNTYQYTRSGKSLLVTRDHKTIYSLQIFELTDHSLIVNGTDSNGYMHLELKR